MEAKQNHEKQILFTAECKKTKWQFKEREMLIFFGTERVSIIKLAEA